MTDSAYDLVIIGSGPGGYVAAVRAGQLGLKTAIIEGGPLGGVCLNIGCIPTKALLHSADLLDELRESKRFGVNTGEVQFDFEAAMKNKQAIVKQSSDGVAYLMKKHKVDVIEGWAKLRAPGQVVVQLNKGGEQTIQAKKTILALGAQPRELPTITFDHERILSSTDMLSLKEIPKRLIVIGAGAIGIEFASMYRAFGSEVTVLEAQSRIVPLEDEEVSAELHKALARRGISLMPGVKVNGVEKTEKGVSAFITDASGAEKTVEGDKLLLAVSITPRTKGVGLEETGITLDQRGFIQINEYMQTNVPDVYAIGDIVPTPWLAHVASAEGILAVEHLAGQHAQPINYRAIPGCTYCSPEVASVGLTEAKAREQGYEVKVGKFPFSANGKARILGQNRFGFVKIVGEARYGQILGMHLIGPRVTEQIGEGVVAITHEATAESLMHSIHAHPTVHEAIGEAAHALVNGEAIHI